MRYKLIVTRQRPDLSHEQNINNFLQEISDIQVHTLRTWIGGVYSDYFYTEILYTKLSIHPHKTINDET